MTLFFVVFFCLWSLVFCFVHSLYRFMVTQSLSSPIRITLTPFFLPHSLLSLLLPSLRYFLYSVSSFFPYLPSFFFSFFKTNNQTSKTIWAFLEFLTHCLVQHITSGSDLSFSTLSLPQFDQIQRRLRAVCLNLKNRQGKCSEIRRTRHPLSLKIFPRGQKREGEGNTIWAELPWYLGCCRNWGVVSFGLPWNLCVDYLALNSDSDAWPGYLILLLDFPKWGWWKHSPSWVEDGEIHELA